MNAPVDELTRRPAYRVLTAVTVGVAAVTFVLSFHGLDGYGRNVALIPGYLAWLVPVGVDGLTLCGVAATLLLRHAHWRARAYAWMVFGLAVALSVAGNVVDAAARHVQPRGMVGAAAWPLLLAAASHLVVVTRRAMDRTATGVATQIEPVTAAQEPEAATEKPAVDPQAYARRQAGRGKAGTEIAKALQGLGHDVTERQVQRWTKEIRERRASVAAPEPAPTNGHAVPALAGRSHVHTEES